jgi:hypothetical protein
MQSTGRPITIEMIPRVRMYSSSMSMGDADYVGSREGVFSSLPFLRYPSMTF